MAQLLVEIQEFLMTTGIASITWQEAVMIVVSCVLLYLAIAKGFEPLLLIPIAFGMLLVNLPLGEVMGHPQSIVSIIAPDNIDVMELQEMAQNGQFYFQTKTVS